MNYNRFEARCMNKAVMDEFIRQLEEVNLEPVRNEDGRVEVYIPSQDPDFLESISLAYPDEVIHTETRHEHDSNRKIFTWEYQNGNKLLTGVRINYIFSFLAGEYQIDKLDNLKINDVLIDFFRRTDNAKVFPDNKYEVDMNEDKEISVTMETGDYKFTAMKRGNMITITGLKKKMITKTWESVKLQDSELVINHEDGSH